jgi:uncharacterized membrane protein YbhN (UPF0104 family)
MGCVQVVFFAMGITGLLRRHGRLIFGITLAAAALAYTLAQIDWATFFQALRSTNYLAFLAFVMTFVAAMLTADAFATAYIFSQTIGKIRYRDVFVLRGASYLPTMVNYHLGQAFFTWFLSRVHGAPVWRVAGTTFLVYASTVGSLLVMAAGSYLLRPDAFPWLGPTLGLSVILGLIYFAVITFGKRQLVRFEPLRVLIEAGPLGHLRAIFVRLPHIAVLFLGSWVPFWLFGIHIPFADALALIPILLLVGALPLTPQGLGTRELVALNLFSPYAQGSPQEAAARITACSLSWAIAFTLAEVVISLITAPRAHRLMPKKDG